MNLLLINYEYPPVGGGAATACQGLARALADLGHEVHVLTAAFDRWRGATTEDGVHIHRIAALRARAEACSILEMGSFVASALWTARPLARRHQIQGVIAFFSFPCGPVAWWCDLPYVISLRGGDVPGTEPGLTRLHRLLAPMRRHVLRSACAVVANSTGLRRLAEAADPVSVAVIPNGVDTSLFVPPAPAKPYSGPLRLLFAGRLQPQKNLSWLLRQLASPKLPTCRLSIVGEGPLRPTLQAEARMLGLAHRIEWLGWRPRGELAVIYRNHDLLVNPSLYEGMPNVVLEAMACGLPVLASQVAGNDSLVRDGENGFLFALDDPDAFAAALNGMVSETARARLGQQARLTAEAHSWAAVARAYLDCFSVR